MTGIGISEITLREEGKGYSLSFKEKIEVAGILDKLNVNVIETAPITKGRTDILFLHSAASLIKNSILSCPAGLSAESVEETFDAIKDAKHPRLHIMASVSTVQMEYIHHMKPAALLEALEATVKRAKELTEDVEVSLLDATRAEAEMLYKAVRVAVNAGAGTVTLCDSSGEMMPAEFGKFIENIFDAVPEVKSVKLGVECSDSLHMAAACTISCIKNGVSQIKTSTLSEECPSLSAIAHIFRAKADSLGVSTSINMSVLDSSIDKIKIMTRGVSSKSAALGVSGGVSESFKLGINDDVTSVKAAVESLGYTLSEEDTAKVFEEFEKISKNKSVGPKELEAIVASVAMQVPATYKLKSYLINSSNVISSTAHIELEKNGETLSGVCVGDGPVAAAFLAIEQITGRHFELDDFQIQSVTEGREAVGSSIVKLRENGKPYSGKGISTDIIGASIKAYINALNKLCFEEQV